MFELLPCLVAVSLKLVVCFAIIFQPIEIGFALGEENPFVAGVFDFG
jgi:uncharacterized ion transporter superfamily protein YfcC